MDIRDCYKIVKEALYVPKYTKIVFILHSQGGIEGSMIIDWLLQEVPQDLLAKLEVYTFGNAANHFNDPHQHLLSQHAALSNPGSVYTTKTTTHIHYHDIVPGTDRGREPNMRPSYQKSLAGKSIRYIEHYANTSDFVARWGVLAYLHNSYFTPTAPRYMGRVFERAGGRGHQFNQHYLDNMFPLQDSAEDQGGVGNSGFEGAANESAFMETVVEWDGGGNDGKCEREGLEMSYLAAKGEPLEKDEEETLISDMSPISSSSSMNALKGVFKNGGGITSSNGNGTKERTQVQFRVKDLSRLWAYRNGRSPKMDETDVGIARIATI